MCNSYGASNRKTVRVAGGVVIATPSSESRVGGFETAAAAAVTLVLRTTGHAPSPLNSKLLIESALYDPC